MKKIVYIITALIVGFGGALMEAGAENGRFENISPGEAFKLIEKYENSSKVVILDIRTPGEFRSGRIENSINIDYYSPKFKSMLSELDKNLIYIVYCRSANRSGRAMSVFRKLGFREVYNVTGGILSWKRNGFKTVK